MFSWLFDWPYRAALKAKIKGIVDTQMRFINSAFRLSVADINRADFIASELTQFISTIEDPLEQMYYNEALRYRLGHLARIKANFTKNQLLEQRLAQVPTPKFRSF